MFQSGLVTNTEGIVLKKEESMIFFKYIDIYDKNLPKKYTQHFKNCIEQYKYPKLGRNQKIQTKTQKSKVSNSAKKIMRIKIFKIELNN